VKRALILMGSLLWLACSEKIPPVGPQQTGKPEPDLPPPQEIDDPAPGGGGAGEPYNYVWVPLWDVKLKYLGGAPLSPEGQRLKDYATSHTFQFNYGTTQNKWCPVLVNQDAEADQLCLAYAIYYGCDGGAASSYYHDAWHAIRSMMRQWYDMPALSNWCNDGWIGMARNLLPYLVAADYLNSLGPIGTNGNFGFNNQQTFDSLKVFARKFRQADLSVRAPASATCTNRIQHLRDMCRPQVNQTGLGSPDNKGSAALASYLGATIFCKNRDSEISAWYDHRQGHFNNNRFANYPTWEDTWVQVDGINSHPQPILSATATPRSWPYPSNPTHTWGNVSGLLTDDLIRAGKPSEQAAATPVTNPQVFVYNTHVSGSTNYMVNAAELLYQDGITSGDQFGWASDGPKRTALWHEQNAANQDQYWPGGIDWPKLRDTADDWPCSYILVKRGYNDIQPGRQNPLASEGKQMSFTDLTHRAQ
jgi:hypothetical protein